MVTIPENRVTKLTRKIISIPKCKPLFYDVGLSKTSKFADWIYSAQCIYKNVNASYYPKIVFFDVFQLTACLPLIPKNQVVILNPVTPELASSETAFQKDNFTEDDIIWSKKAEAIAFERADILIFANEGAKKINQSLINNKSKIYYLHHGALQITEDRIIPLDESNINLLYIGRRIPIKGFDIILDAFKQANLINSNINLILLGNGQRINGKNIYDLGFSSTPHLWIKSVDYVINCNRQSYFDLSVLETLSVGTPLLMSATLGHELYKNFTSEGIIDIGEPTVENLKKILISKNLKKKKDNCIAVNSNISLFNQYFTRERSIMQFENFLKEL